MRNRLFQLMDNYMMNDPIFGVYSNMVLYSMMMSSILFFIGIIDLD